MENSIIDLFKDKLKSTEKMTEKQRQILETSIDLFAEKGFANTSTSEIAKKSNVAEGTIFKHFGSKENLLLATIAPFVFDNVLPEVANQFVENALKNDYLDFRSFVYSIAKDRINFINENSKVGKILFSEIMYRDEMREKLFYLIPKDAINSMNKIIDTFKAKQLIVDWPNPIIIRFIITNLVGYAVCKHILYPYDNWNDEKEINYLTDLLVNGLSPK